MTATAMPVRPIVVRAEPAGQTARVVARDARSITTAIARGDSDAMRDHYEAWFEPCYALARRITRRDESFCLDVVQEAMLRVVRAMPVLETETQLRTWMGAVVRSAAIDLLRRETRRTARERRAHAAPMGDADAAARHLAAETATWLRRELDALPAQDRELLRLRFAGDRTLRETAAAAGVTCGAAHGRIRRALASLRKEGKERFHDS